MDGPSRGHRTGAELVGVYNAHGGLMGELRYLGGRITGRSHCALCDITHGMNPLGRAEWKLMVPTLPLPMRTVHLNEMDAATRRAMADEPAPAVLLLDGDTGRVLLTGGQLEECAGDPKHLAELITAALEPGNRRPR